MKIAIFGSCVSRDTAEYIPDVDVVTYVARHSVTSLVTPHGSDGVDLSGLESAFQRRMVVNDLEGNGVARIVKDAKHIELVLIDLVDERRGFWLFHDGTTMTNSLEAESCGATRQARRDQARLIEFGTDEHFEAWKSGIDRLKSELAVAGLWERTVLLDIEWAGAIAGAPHPRNDVISMLGRRWRRAQRGTREVRRSFARGLGIGEACRQMRTVQPTETEDYADRAFAANNAYARYRREAHSRAISAVVRSSSEVRIGINHRWGPQPFHYRDQDYVSIMQETLRHIDRIGGRDL